MITTVDQQRVARALLTYMAEPGDPVLAAWLEVASPPGVIASITAGRLPQLPAMGLGSLGDLQAEKVEHAFAIWSQRLGDLADRLDLDEFRREGIRLVCPGDSEWPTQLDTLGVTRPYALWLRGEADLRYCCLQSVSMVGARASSAYGQHVGTEMAAALAERGWTVVSGGAYGIDGCAHRGALAAEGVTIAVLACGVDHAYPPGHHDLLNAVAAQGVLVSEWPPGRVPNKLRFLIRNRVIGALTRGTVVVEAGLRSGALSTARHARDLRRPVMAVPGPVTSEVSAGCHKIIREWGAVCVTDAHDVIDLLTPLSEVAAYGSATHPHVLTRPDGVPGIPGRAPGGPGSVPGLPGSDDPSHNSGSPGPEGRDPGVPSHLSDSGAASPPGAPSLSLRLPGRDPSPDYRSVSSRSGYRSAGTRPTWVPIASSAHTPDPARAASLGRTAAPPSATRPPRATNSAHVTGPALDDSADASHPTTTLGSVTTLDPTQRPTPVHQSWATSPSSPADHVSPVSPARSPLVIAEPVPSRRRVALLPRDQLSATSRRVLDVIPARGAGPAVIAVGAGLDVDTVVSALGLLAAGGFVERCSRGWRIRRSP